MPELGKLPLAILKQVLLNNRQRRSRDGPRSWHGRLYPIRRSPARRTTCKISRPPPSLLLPAPAVGPAADAAVSPTTSVVGWVTGVDTGANTLQKFSISGTDLGIMWDNGDNAAVRC